MPYLELCIDYTDRVTIHVYSLFSIQSIHFYLDTWLFS